MSFLLSKYIYLYKHINTMQNTNNIFYRIDDKTYNKLTKIKQDFKFRSNAELAKTITEVFCNLYSDKQPKEQSIEDIFREFEDTEESFRYEKPKKIRNYNDYDIE